jgi:DNA-binding CsgD family transcriptional regulator
MDKIEKLKQLINTDKTIEEIAKELGVAVSTLYMKKEFRDIIEQRKKKQAVEKMYEILDELKNGKTVAEIAKERNMNPWTIYQYINVKTLQIRDKFKK